MSTVVSRLCSAREMGLGITVKELNETSLEEMMKVMVKQLPQQPLYRISPTRIAVTQGRIIRVRRFRWFWLGPTGSRYWGTLGPFYWQCTARRSAATLPTAPGFCSLADFLDAVKPYELPWNVFAELTGESK